MPDLVAFSGQAMIALLCIAYALVFLEELLNLRKSAPVMVAGGLIWILVAVHYHFTGHSADVSTRLRSVLLEYAELFLFLLCATSFVNAMVERNLFEALRSQLTRRQFSQRTVFWLTGAIAFVLSPVADNLTTALVAGTIAIAALGNNRKATVASLVNIVVAANAGGAFSPFGDITTLMVWQKGVVQFGEFFKLFVPALISWLIPAAIMSWSITGPAEEVQSENVTVKKGGYVIACMFLCTIATTILLDHILYLPPFLGMMMGLGVLNVYSYFLHRYESNRCTVELPESTMYIQFGQDNTAAPFNIFNILRMAEWDTFLFFYGIMFCVGGLGAIGYLDRLSSFFYASLGNTTANILIGLLSAIIDNIPLTYAVLTTMPHMDTSQWLLVTLAAGIGGSLLSIGSAAGVALMGISNGRYTFFSHLKWSWAILLGYASGIGAHIYIGSMRN